ncbi:MAG: SDR family NAD(P)-dependent oxidoreductase, partial [Asticcacaulis sp.]|nr:SDR family NAD(P)-dependent oxidoreductase [Asticcacaulis sp.]
MSRPLFDLSGRTALVTGSGQGLGLVMATGLANAGARIVLNGRSEERLQAAAASLRDAGHEVLLCPFDVTDGDAAE